MSGRHSPPELDSTCLTHRLPIGCGVGGAAHRGHTGDVSCLQPIRKGTEHPCTPEAKRGKVSNTAKCVIRAAVASWHWGLSANRKHRALALAREYRARRFSHGQSGARGVGRMKWPGAMCAAARPRRAVNKHAGRCRRINGRPQHHFTANCHVDLTERQRRPDRSG